MTAIVVAPRGPTGTLQVLIDRLASAGVEVRVVDDLGGAAELVAQTPAAPPCVLLDLREVAVGSDVEDIKEATEWIRRAVKALPHVLPVAVTGEADAGLIIACIRAGAGDVLDLQLEGTANARTVVQRITQRQRENAGHAHDAAGLRAMIEDLLKDLIRTERRSLDLEARLAGGEHPTSELGRPPMILIVEPDRAIADQLAERLEAANVVTFAYLSGEDALREVDGLLASGTGLDMAVVAVQLPGIDGLDTVRALRGRIAGLPAFLMTAVQDAELAARAADLGVVGFVGKPLRDVEEVVGRLSQLAHDALQRSRDHKYLQQIKERHEAVLARYRSLPREP